VLSEVVEKVFNPMHMSATEQNLIKHLRGLCGDAPGVPLVFSGKGVIALVTV